MTGGIQISGLRKYYGEVRAVDGIDIDICGPRWSPCSVRTARAIHHHRHAARLTRPDAGRISFKDESGRAAASGTVGAAADRIPIKGSPCRLIEMLAALYEGHAGRRCLKRARVGDITNRRSKKLSEARRSALRDVCSRPDVLSSATAVAMDVR
jgi:ABC-2 type transport system ATP-binding protein